jgi:peptide/nickel transport system substrate-binding protein
MFLNPAYRSRGRSRHPQEGLKLLVVLTITALVAVACGSSTATTTGSSTLTVALADSPQSLDPLQAWNSYTDIISLATYDALVQYPPGAPTTLQPQLAQSWTVSSDGKAYTFTLRSGVKFHDGSTFTADDVKYTLDRVKAINNGVAYEILPAYDSSDVISPTQIKVNLSSAYAPFLGGLSRIYIVNSKLVKANEGSDNGQKWLALHEAGSGPYTLGTYTAGTSTVLNAYGSYWRGQAKIGKVVLRVIREPATQLLALKSGEVNVALDIAKSDLDSLKTEGKFKVNTTDTLLQFYIAFNTHSKGPVGDVRVRKALSYAYDYQTHLQQILGGYAGPAQGPLPIAMPCHDSNVTQPTFDLNMTTQLLAAAGYKPSSIHLQMAYDPTIEEHVKAVQLFQSTLRGIGITVDAVPLQFTPYVDTLKSFATTKDLAAIYEFADYPDPHAVLFPHFSSTFTPGNGGYNWSQYTNPTVDNLMSQAVGLQTIDQRCPIYAQIQETIANDYPVINVSNGGLFAVVVTAPSVQGYKYNLAHHRTVNFYDISLTK